MFRKIRIRWQVWRGKAIDIWSKSPYPASMTGARFRKMQNIGLLEAKVRRFCPKSTEVYLKEVRCFCFPKKGILGAVKYRDCRKNYRVR